MIEIQIKRILISLNLKKSKRETSKKEEFNFKDQKQEVQVSIKKRMINIWKLQGKIKNTVEIMICLSRLKVQLKLFKMKKQIWNDWYWIYLQKNKINK